jgi:4-amino-4-deoxy-L-arabinose transferase-like glycosyltransferase
VFAKGRWEKAVLVVFILMAPILAFYNLRTNPRPWHDEGSYLLLAKTLVEDGVYAVRNSDGYQTYGVVQSVGPTVILPIALGFKLLGVGLVQGRIVSGLLLLLSLAVFYASAHMLFGRRSALFAVFLLVAAPAAEFLLLGRPAFGDIPAFGFLLSGWLVWALGVRAGRRWLNLPAGLLLGAAMVTKSQYMIMGAGALGLLVILDLLYYRQRLYKGLIVVGLVALSCVAAWWLWQILYYGMAEFQQNAAKMRLLASQTFGLSLRTTLDAIIALTGTRTGYFFYFWGFLALIYGGLLCLPREKQSAIMAFLLLFAGVWLAYYMFWVIPWPRYLFPVAATTAIFVGKLCSDLLGGFWASRRTVWNDLRRLRSARFALNPGTLTSLGTLIALVSFVLLMAYQLQSAIRLNVLDKTGKEIALVQSPPQFESPGRMVVFLNQEIDKNAVIETWERELGILTDHRYHYPDESLLTQTTRFLHRGGPRDYALGAEYFDRVRPAYVVEGWFARYNQIYDTDFLRKHGTLIASDGDGEWRYDVYRLQP